jgi:hypothetical protein
MQFCTATFCFLFQFPCIASLSIRSRTDIGSDMVEGKKKRIRNPCGTLLEEQQPRGVKTSVITVADTANE